MSNALKLFCLRHGKGGAVVTGDNNQPLYFREKRDAKIAREQRQGTVVSYGPDHKLYKGEK
jgi:hypothetical protein